MTTTGRESGQIDPALLERLEAAYDAAVPEGMHGAAFWKCSAEIDAELAAVWQAIRHALPPGTESFIIRAIVDAEYYRKLEARRAKQYAAESDLEAHA